MRTLANRSSQRGVAVVIAMGVAALATITATAILVAQSAWARQLELTTQHAQARLVVEAGIDWTRAILSDDRRTNNVDHLGEPWALRLSPVSIESGSLAGHIEDQQGAFNLNNLVKDGKTNLAQLARFQRLLSLLGLPPDLAMALADWMDDDGEAQAPGGAEDDYYLALQTPYRTANRPLTDVAELALVRGYDESVLARLRPFVTALPRATAVNVNTARPEVLAAIIEGLSLDRAWALVSQRERAHFRDTAEFVNRAPREVTVPPDAVAVSSNYFIVTVRVNILQAEAGGTALLARQGTGWPDIVWRKVP